MRPSSDPFEKVSKFFSLPFAVQWRFLLVRAPWAVPLRVLRWTSSPPYPFIVHLPSRGTHKIPVYVFIPNDIKATNGFAVHLDFHGGGFIMGSCLEQAPFCSMIARERGAIVISVDYRMGPMSQFPAAVEDAEDVLAAILDSESNTKAGKKLRKEIHKKVHKPCTDAAHVLDPTHISISGFSSGGNLALNLAMSILDWPSLLPASEVPVPLILFYPSFDSRLLPSERPRPPCMGPAPEDSRSTLKLATILGPTYLPPDKRSHPRASPGLADVDKGLHQRARIWLCLPEWDTLSVQSEEWVKKANNEGRGEVLTVERVEGMRHGWTQFPETFLKEHETREKNRVFDEMVKWMEGVCPTSRTAAATEEPSEILVTGGKIKESS